MTLRLPPEAMAASCAACSAKQRRATASRCQLSTWRVARTRSRRSLDPGSRTGIWSSSGSRLTPGNERSAWSSRFSVTPAEPAFRTVPEPRTGVRARASNPTISTSSPARGVRKATTRDRLRGRSNRASIGWLSAPASHPRILQQLITIQRSDPLTPDGRKMSVAPLAIGPVSQMLLACRATGSETDGPAGGAFVSPGAPGHRLALVPEFSTIPKISRKTGRKPAAHHAAAANHQLPVAGRCAERAPRFAANGPSPHVSGMIPLSTPGTRGVGVIYIL